MEGHAQNCASRQRVTAEERPDLSAWELNRAVHDCTCGALRKAQRAQDLQYVKRLAVFGLATHQLRKKKNT